jgi:hypothetical protein
MTVQELMDWLEGVCDPDGVDDVDPDATVQVAVVEPGGHAKLLLETMGGETLMLPLGRVCGLSMDPKEGGAR